MRALPLRAISGTDGSPYRIHAKVEAPPAVTRISAMPSSYRIKRGRAANAARLKKGRVSYDSASGRPVNTERRSRYSSTAK